MQPICSASFAKVVFWGQFLAVFGADFGADFGAGFGVDFGPILGLVRGPKFGQWPVGFFDFDSSRKVANKTLKFQKL